MNVFSKNATAVLVHGAWADGSSWNRVILPLLHENLTVICAPIPLTVGCIQEVAPKPAWKSKPSWFLIAEDDRMINLRTQHFMAERMGAKVRAHRVDHTPLLTAPEVVVDIVCEAARETLVG
jgi:hypothetical protein